jgi:hypothetical protein
MTNVIAITGDIPMQAAQPNQQVIDFLEDLLDWAKEGRVQAIATAWLEADGTPMDAYMPSGATFAQVMPLIGSLDLCKHTLLMNMYESSTA